MRRALSFASASWHSLSDYIQTRRAKRERQKLYRDLDQAVHTMDSDDDAMDLETATVIDSDILALTKVRLILGSNKIPFRQ